MTQNFKSDRGKEFALHGFMRRMGTIVRAVDQVFTLLPPEREDIPEREEVQDAIIAIQSFVLNIFGCLDNLAWIWVCERAVKAKNGTELGPNAIGLLKTHRQVRASMSNELQTYLDSHEAWFDHIKSLRDALAHRIPLYIPPYVVRTANMDEHNRLEQEATEALNRLNTARYDQARNDQKKLGEFRPWMTHSFSEQAPHIIFHGQLLSDYATIDELAGKILVGLDA